MNKPWFKAKRYGLGWGLPVTWQGWIVFILYVAFIIFAAIQAASHIPHDHHHILRFLSAYLPQVLIASAILFLIVYVTGEKPQWRWGKNKRK